MKLYYFETPNARRPCAVARHLDLPVEFVRVDLTQGEHKRPEFLAVNPNGRVPALEDGDVRLWESHAIMCYLAHKAGSPMWPADELQKIDILRWLLWDAAHFSRHAGRLFFERVIRTAVGMGEPKADEIEDATGFFRQFAAVLNRHLQGRDYVSGNGLTVADFALATYLPAASAAQLPLDDCDEIRRWHATLMELPAWQQPFPG